MRTKSEVVVSLKLMILKLLMVELNAGWVYMTKAMKFHWQPLAAIGGQWHLVRGRYP